MAPTDEVISWKWLLNKKDITIVVAPERGADLNVREVARRIMRLAEKNSAAFARANAKRAERMQTISDLKAEITQLEGELKSAQNELEVAKLEWEEAQERAKSQTNVGSDEDDDDRPLSPEERAAIVQRARNSHTIGVADPDEPESNEEVRNINGTPTIVVNTAKTGKAVNGAQPDLSYRRSADGLFTSFYPNTPAGKDAWETMNATQGGERGKVLATHTEAVIQQLRDAGYTVAEDTTPAATQKEIDALAKELEEQAANEQALIDAYFKAHIEDAEQIKAAVAAVNWEGIKSNEDAWAAYHRLEDAAHEKSPIAAALANLKAIGIASTNPLLSSFGRSEPSVRSAALTLYFNAMEKIKAIADEKLIEEGKAELAALPDNASLTDMARAVYRKYGINDKHHKPYAGIVASIQSKNADGVWDLLKVLRNKASAEVFERATGIKLAKTQRDRRAQIDAWASITPEQRAEKEAAKDAAWLADEREKIVKSTFVALGRMNVRNKDNTISSGHEYLLGLVADGFDTAQSVKRGAALIYGLSNGKVLSAVKNRTFSNFIKAVIAYGGLRQALELVGVEMPQIDTQQSKTDKITAVDAAYAFSSASDGFKAWLHESLNKPDHSPFVTAKAMDEAAKRHNAIVEWDKSTPALDDTGHSVPSLQAGLAVIEKQAADNATGLEAETAVNIRKAIDALEDEDYAPSEEEIGGFFEAETVALLGQQTLDAVDNEPDYVGKIKRDGEVVGRIDIADDGKAMVYVGATGDQRVVFPSGTTAMYSADDAVLMVDALFATQEQTASEPKTDTLGEIPGGLGEADMAVLVAALYKPPYRQGHALEMMSEADGERYFSIRDDLIKSGYLSKTGTPTKKGTALLEAFAKQLGGSDGLNPWIEAQKKKHRPEQDEDEEQWKAKLEAVISVLKNNYGYEYASKWSAGYDSSILVPPFETNDDYEDNPLEIANYEARLTVTINDAEIDVGDSTTQTAEALAAAIDALIRRGRGKSTAYIQATQTLEQGAAQAGMDVHYGDFNASTSGGLFDTVTGSELVIGITAQLHTSGTVWARARISEEGELTILRSASGQDVAGKPGSATELAELLRSIKAGVFGEIFHGYTNRPEAAIDKLMSERRGEVPDAFVHPELGNIAFVYGNEQMGLRHIEVKHPEMLARIPDILRTGRLVRDDGSVPRAYIVQDGNPAQLAVLRLAWDGEQKIWLVTAHEDDVGRFSQHSQKESPDAPSGVIPEQPTHTGNPVVDSKVVAGQGNSTTKASSKPAKSEPPAQVSTTNDDAVNTARTLFQSVINGTVPDILAPELADEMETAYLPVQGDTEIEALFERAAAAYRDALLAATANL